MECRDLFTTIMALIRIETLMNNNVSKMTLRRLVVRGLERKKLIVLCHVMFNL